MTKDTCANCYTLTSCKITVGSIAGLVFCSTNCGMEALKRKGTKRQETQALIMSEWGVNIDA